MYQHPKKKLVVYKSLSFLGFSKYRVGDDGSVWSCYRSAWRRLKHGTGRYPMVLLYNYSDKPRPYLVHQLVLLAFVGPCPEGMVARHYPDPDRLNNRLDNLSWATQKVNQQDRVEHDTHIRGERHPVSKLTEAEVIKIKLLWNTGKHTKVDLGKLFGVSRTLIKNIVTGKAWKHV